MEPLERVLAERAEELAKEVGVRAGLSPEQARRLVELAGSDLIASYHWQRSTLGWADLSEPLLAREILGSIPGRSVAERVGLPTAQAWDGLRALVPAALEAAVRESRLRA